MLNNVAHHLVRLPAPPSQLPRIPRRHRLDPRRPHRKSSPRARPLLPIRTKPQQPQHLQPNQPPPLNLVQTGSHGPKTPLQQIPPSSDQGGGFRDLGSGIEGFGGEDGGFGGESRG